LICISRGVDSRVSSRIIANRRMNYTDRPCR
jgi:hypothetical protein